MLDGVTGVLQDRLRALHDTQALQMMFAVNFFSPFYLLAGMVQDYPSLPHPPSLNLPSSTLTGMLYTGEGVEAIGFISRHPEVIFNIIIFCISSAVGQIFIFITIVHFGPLVCSIITTTRKFFTILASIVIFSNALLPRQWVGMMLVFTGLGLDAYQGKAKQKPSTQDTQSV